MKQTNKRLLAAADAIKISSFYVISATGCDADTKEKDSDSTEDTSGSQ